MRNFIYNKLSFLILLLSFYIVSCATITVNVYFPAEEVRQAYSNLEDEFLIEEDEVEKNVEKNGGESKVESGKPELNIKVTYPDKPTISSRKIIPLKKNVSLEIAEMALAQDDITRQIESKIRNMPDVVKTYKSRNARQAGINALLNGGKAGEANNGLLVERGSLSANDKNILNAENKDRQIIINAMSKAIIEINKLEATPQNIRKVYPEAAEQFANTRRNKAKSGWKVQLPNGKWAVKK